jgi:hypothetical protein
VKHELAFVKGPTQSGYELAAEDTAQNSDRQEKTRARRDPAGVVGRQPAARHNAMDMGVSFNLRRVVYPQVFGTSARAEDAVNCL